MAAGVHSLTINAAGLKPGIYSYVVSAGNERVSRKMIVK
jgi:Uri superfamily endonuclease